LTREKRHQEKNSDAEKTPPKMINIHANVGLNVMSMVSLVFEFCIAKDSGVLISYSYSLS
jgi:hypothetical protein